MDLADVQGIWRNVDSSWLFFEEEKLPSKKKKHHVLLGLKTHLGM